MLLAQADFDVAHDMLNDELQIAHDAYTRYIWDRDQTIAYLGKLNLLGQRMDLLMEKWDLEKSAKPAKPTKAELNTWFEQGLIALSEYRDELKAMGYDKKYIDLYVNIEQAKGAKGASKKPSKPASEKGKSTTKGE